MEVYRIGCDTIRAMDFEGIDKPVDGSTWLTILSRRHQAERKRNVLRVTLHSMFIFLILRKELLDYFQRLKRRVYIKHFFVR
jgi:uncharacterized protein Yka (UPF0111/DUF47 family)